MSQRQSIVTAVGELLATLTKANGYSSDGGRRVKEHPEAPMPTMPAYLFRDTIANVTAGAEIGRHEHSLNIEITALAGGANSVEAARAMLSDVCTAMRIDPTIGGTCNRVSIVAHSIQTDQAEKKFAAGTLTIAAIYRTAAHTI